MSVVIPFPLIGPVNFFSHLFPFNIKALSCLRRLPCTFATQAVLGSFCVQADLGDWEEEEHGYGIDYIRDIPFAPPEDQTPQLLEKIAELHRDRR